MRELVGSKNAIGRTAAVLKKPHKSDLYLFYVMNNYLSALLKEAKAIVSRTRPKGKVAPFSERRPRIL